MKWVKCASIILLLALFGGCASAPPTNSPAALAAAEDECRDQLASFGFPGSFSSTTVPDPGALLIVLSTLDTLGGNFMGFTLCKRQNSVSLAPASTVMGDIYHSQNGEFSVALPASLAIDQQAGIKIWIRANGYLDNVFFVPTQPGGTIYAASVQRKLSSAEAKMSISQYADSLFGSTARLEFDITGGMKVNRLYEENVVLSDGEPAVFEVYRTEIHDNSMTDHAMSQGQNRAPYLIYYVMKTAENAAVLSVLWHGDCLKCSTGLEVDIRKMDPGISKFVESFRLTDDGKAN